MQAVIAKKKRHSRVEIATKLAQATDLATQGKSQREIAHTLGVSVMTLHRWRKVPPGPQTAFVATHEAGQPDRTRGGGDRIAELQLENSRLRRLVTDLLLEKIRLEEAAQGERAADKQNPARLRVGVAEPLNLCPLSGRSGHGGPVAELVGIEGGVVSGVFNLESSGVEAPDRRPRHEEHYHEA